MIQSRKKVNKPQHGLKFIKLCTTECRRRRLVTALVVPHLNNCTAVYLDATFGIRTRLQRLIYFSMRYIYWLSMQERIRHRKR